MTGPHRLAMPVFILTAFFAVCTAHAQFVDWPPTPQAFGIYRFDSAFVLGGHTILDPDVAQKTLHMTFSQEYQKSVDTLQRIMENPFNANELAEQARFLRSDTIGFKYIFLPNRLPEWVYESKSKENWYGLVEAGNLQNLDFKTLFWPGWYPSSIWKLDTFKKGEDYKNQKFFTFGTAAIMGLVRKMSHAVFFPLQGSWPRVRPEDPAQGETAY